jgi:N,N'-diacetyllegionaminate synthase
MACVIYPGCRGFRLSCRVPFRIDSFRGISKRVARAPGFSVMEHTKSKTVTFGDHCIGPGQPCFVIAEAGVNHNGSVQTARELVDAALRAGADAVKFQTFRSELVISPRAEKAPYQRLTTGSNGSQLEMVQALELSFDSFRELYSYCMERGILFLSTAFDRESADFLSQLGMSAFKVPSGEITNLPFLSHIASKNKPVIVSTGMSNLEEVRAAVEILKSVPGIVLLHCTSNYPASPASANLRAMQAMHEAFSLPVGYSDHTLGREVALAAVALGACVIEKHLTLDRNLSGPDHSASMEPDEFAVLVRGVRMVETALGNGVKQPVPEEAAVAAAARRSLVAACNITKGTRLQEQHIAILRPGTGLRPELLPQILGRRLKQNVESGQLFTLEMLQ